MATLLLLSTAYSLHPLSHRAPRARCCRADTLCSSAASLPPPLRDADAFARGHIRDGIVLNDDGTPVPVVHQWDRLLFWKDKRKNHVCYSGLQPRTGLFESAYEVVDRPCPPGHVRYAAIDRVLQITDR